MRDTKDFLSWVYDPQVNRERADAILQMLRFVGEGLRELGGPPKINSDFVLVENYAKAIIYDRTISPVAKPIPKRMFAPHGDTVELIAAAFKDAHNWVSRNAPVATFGCGRFTEEVKARLGAFDHPDANQYERGSLPLAFEVTHSNLARTTTRLTLMHAVAELLKVPSPANPPPAWDSTREQLWTRKLMLQRDLLLLGVLLGGTHLQTATRLVATQTCISENDLNFSLTHFMMRDSVSPGRWMSEFEDGLRDDLAVAYQKVMQC